MGFQAITEVTFSFTVLLLLFRG